MGELWGLNRESSFLKLGSDWLIHDHQPGTGNQADFHGLLFIFYLQIVIFAPQTKQADV